MFPQWAKICEFINPFLGLWSMRQFYRVCDCSRMCDSLDIRSRDKWAPAATRFIMYAPNFFPSSALSSGHFACSKSQGVGKCALHSVCPQHFAFPVSTCKAHLLTIVIFTCRRMILSSRIGWRCIRYWPVCWCGDPRHSVLTPVRISAGNRRWRYIYCECNFWSNCENFPKVSSPYTRTNFPEQVFFSPRFAHVYAHQVFNSLDLLKS